jgi:hypothetical protein
LAEFEGRRGPWLTEHSRTTVTTKVRGSG